MLPRGQMINVLFKDETTYGTAPAGNWTPTFIYSHTLEEKNPKEDDPLLGRARNNNRDQQSKADGLPTHEGQIVVPLCLAHVGYWLALAFGAPATTGAPSDYSHVFTSGGETLPSRSIEIQTPIVGGSIFMQHLGVMANKFTLEVSRAPNFQRITFDLMGQKEVKQTATGGGTPAAAAALDRLLAAIGVFKMDTVQAEILSISAAYDNKLKALDYAGSTYVSGYDSDVESTFGGTLKLRFKTATLYDQAIAGTAFAGEILFQRTSVRSLSLATPVTRLERAGLPISGPGGIEQSFNYWAEQSATAPMLTATLKNGVATY